VGRKALIALIGGAVFAQPTLTWTAGAAGGDWSAISGDRAYTMTSTLHRRTG